MRNFQQFGGDFVDSDGMQQTVPAVNMPGQPFMPFMQSSPGNMAMGPPAGGMGGVPGGMPGPNLGQMQLSPPQGQLPLTNFNQLPQQLPRAEPDRGNMTVPNLGMMPMWPNESRMDNTRMSGPTAPMGGEGQNQMGQMAILTGGPGPQSSGQVMGAFCAQLLGGSMPAPMEQNFRPEKDGEPSMRPFMLQELANAAMMRDLDPNPNISNLPHPRTLLPEQQPVPNMPQQANQNPLLTLQQQQLILQQLQSGQAPPQPQGQSAVPPSQTGLGFCVDGQPQLASAPQLGQLVGPGQLQFPNPNLRTQGMQTLLSDFQDVSSQLQQLHDLREDKPRQLNQPCGNFPAYNAGSMNPDLGMLQPRMEDDLTLMDGLRGLQPKGGKAGKPDGEKLGQCFGGKLGQGVDPNEELRTALSGGKGGKKGSKDGRSGLTGTGPSGPSGPGSKGGKSGKPASGDQSFTTSGIGKMRYGNSPNKLFIGNLSLDVTSDDLIEALKPAGEVLGIRLRQGRYSSIAFAEFKHPGCVDVAVRTLQGLVIKGRPARMEFQSGKNDRPEEENEPREKGGKGKKGKGGKGGGPKGHAAVPRQPGPVPPGPMGGALPPRLPQAKPEVDD